MNSNTAAPPPSSYTDAVRPGDKVLLIDDLIATGGTMMAGKSCWKNWALPSWKGPPLWICPNWAAPHCCKPWGSCRCSPWWTLLPGTEQVLKNVFMISNEGVGMRFGMGCEAQTTAIMALARFGDADRQPAPDRRHVLNVQHSSSTSTQCRTGMLVPACRWLMQPMLAERMAAGGLSSVKASPGPSLRLRSCCEISACSTEYVRPSRSTGALRCARFSG